MTTTNNKAFIETLPERCRMCYTCVRECPAKAIRIVEGQAQVVPDRCIACGNCVKVCSQNAKLPVRTTDRVCALLDGPEKVCAIVAPSFPAEFDDIAFPELVNMIRRLGFAVVSEVGFGADLVAERYRRMLAENSSNRYIATSCPAIFGYVERYYPELVEHLAPIVSPMVAMARVMRQLHGQATKIVFIGPCIAKKIESDSETIPNEVDAAVTFTELRDLFEQAGLQPVPSPEEDFDPPHAEMGAVFPISRGMLQAAGVSEDLVDGRVIATEGRNNFLEAIKEFATGNLEAELLEVLACQGCIMGPGVSNEDPRYRRRARVSSYVRERISRGDHDVWNAYMDRFADLDLARPFAVHDQRIGIPSEDEMQRILRRMGKFESADELNCGACGYDTCREHAVAIFKGLAESEMCLPYTIDKLRTTIQELANSHEELASTQEALMHSEKLASMGQLAAGIAHEVNNPLGVVLMYAHILLDECRDKAEAGGMTEDLQMIAEQADRCKKIVSGLLHFARQNRVLRQPTDVRELLSKSLTTVPCPPGVRVEVQDALDDETCIAEIDRDQIIQVITNLVSNAYQAMTDGGTLSICSAARNGQVVVSVTDTGCGIAEENRKKIFDPFFTTKQMGKGTGLGLSVAYGIIKMHKGNISVESNDDPQAGPTGTTFTVELPRQGAETP